MTMHRLVSTIFFIVIGVAPVQAQTTWPGRERPQPEACMPAVGDAASWLRRADSATGLAALKTRVLAFRATDTYTAMEQSDRVYAPFITSHYDQLWWLDASTGAERWGLVLPANASRPRDRLRNGTATVIVDDSGIARLDPRSAAAYAQSLAFYTATRALNPLAVLRDFDHAGDVAVTEQCMFRDYPRIVLRRKTTGERLYLDEKTAVPVKLQREEGDYVWGQVSVEYIYTTWTDVGPVILPVVAVRLIDGVEEWRRVPSRTGPNPATSIAHDSAPAMPALPDNAVATATTLPSYTAESPVDTVRVSANTFLLRHPAYTHAVTLSRDTVFLLDASTGEWRSRADSAWIAKLFPGKHAMVVVVTDIAWPHVSGLRFWAARGASIVTHPVSKPFLEQVLSRRWTRTPDALEQGRAKAHPVIRTTSSGLNLGGGAIRLAPIDGVASEGALVAMIPADGFLWASDYIQTVQQTSLYAREVAAAVRRAGFAPTRVAAEHLPLAPWSVVEAITKR